MGSPLGNCRHHWGSVQQCVGHHNIAIRARTARDGGRRGGAIGALPSRLNHHANTHSTAARTPLLYVRPSPGPV